MKNYLHYKIIGLIFLCLAIFSGCEIQNDHKGNGNVTTERRNATNFDEININGVLDVYLKQGVAFRIEVVTDENLQEIIETNVNNRILLVKTKDDQEYDATQMDIYITVPDIRRIKLEGVTALYTQDTLELSSVEIEKLNTGLLNFNAIVDNLTLFSSGIGDIELSGKGRYVTIENDMVGDIKAFEFKIYDLNLVHNGTGQVEVYVTNNFDIQLTGVGDVYCKGSPVKITNTGENTTGRLYLVD
jgi:hypothetical protein